MLGTFVVIVITAVGVGDLLSHGSLGVVLIQVPCSKYNPDIRDFFFTWGLLYLPRCTTGHNFLWGCQSALPPEREDFLFIHGIPEGYRAFQITLYPKSRRRWKSLVISDKIKEFSWRICVCVLLWSFLAKDKSRRTIGGFQFSCVPEFADGRKDKLWDPDHTNAFLFENASIWNRSWKRFKTKRISVKGRKRIKTAIWQARMFLPCS